MFSALLVAATCPPKDAAHCRDEFFLMKLWSLYMANILEKVSGCSLIIVGRTMILLLPSPGLGIVHATSVLYYDNLEMFKGNSAFLPFKV